jgi:hypothetical protein
MHDWTEVASNAFVAIFRELTALPQYYGDSAPGRESINSDRSADVSLDAHSRLRSDIS